MAIKRDIQGFTLIEILIVMVIIAMLTALVLPAIGAGLRNWQLRTASAELLSALRLARTEAVSSKLVQAVRIDLGNDRIDRVQATALAVATGEMENFIRSQIDALIGDETPVVDIIEFGAEQDYEVSGVHYILFYPRGNSSGGRVVMKHREGERKMVVTVAPITGRARIEKPKGDS